MPEKNIEAIENRIHKLEQENVYLKTLLDKAGIAYVPMKKQVDNATPDNQGSRIKRFNITEAMVNLFYSYFKVGRALYR